MASMKEMLRETKINSIALTDDDAWPAMTDPRKRVLYIHEDTKRLYNALVKRYKDSEFYCIETSYSSAMPNYSLTIHDDNKVELIDKSSLKRFLQRAKNDNSDKTYILLINWSDLTSKVRLSLNTVIDDHYPSIQGLPIPDNVRVEGVIKQLGDDRSFLSRHDFCYHVLLLPQVFKLKQDQEGKRNAIKS